MVQQLIRRSRSVITLLILYHKRKKVDKKLNQTQLEPRTSVRQTTESGKVDLERQMIEGEIDRARQK